MDTGKDFTIRWYHSLQFRVVAIFLTMFLLILLAIYAVARTVGENLVEEQTYRKVSDAASHVVSELEKRTVMASTIAHSIARIATTLDVNDSHFSDTVARVIDRRDATGIIAGGGIWPEPYRLNPEAALYSFFWGRNSDGELEFYDEYNKADGAGYHHEEWYVPTRYLGEGHEYWSKSYTDPHSLQPMVTVSVPLIRDGENLGAATVDLKLEGLQALLRDATASFGGYAFAVDRNGRFLSFPDNAVAVTSERSAEDGSLVPFVLIRELADDIPAFKPFEQLLRDQINKVLSSSQQDSERARFLAEQLSAKSYQITTGEASLIAAGIIGNSSSVPPGIDAHTALGDDYFLGEPVFVSITTMPKTLWQIVTVMPDSAARKEADAIFNRFLSIVVIAVIAAMLLVWLQVRYLLTGPLTQLSRQLSNEVSNGDSVKALVATRDKGELGALTHWFNRRTRQLLDSQAQIERLAFFDSLTNLPNRRLLIDRLEERLDMARRGICSGSVLFVDLDQFKHINDSLGHNIGDELLIKISKRLKETLWTDDVIARIGGDEFVILLVSKTPTRTLVSRQAFLVAKKIIECLSVPFQLRGAEYYISASIGISLYPDGSQSVEDILKQADTAMYKAKASGRNTYCFFEKDMQDEVDRRLRIEKELRTAIDENELFLVFQPQVNLYGECNSAEALIRWHHPSGTIFTPAEFIPIAEESTLIHAMGNWVLREACRYLDDWNKQGLDIHHIAINVSPRQFQQSDIVTDLTLALSEFDVQPQQVMLEITEGVILYHTEDTIAKMKQLKAMGIKISIDDFGTGYSSLRYLKLLPLDQLKIDQSFVHDLTREQNDEIIVQTVLSMAENLGLEVIAEGVESEEQYRILHTKGCHLFQGFYFSKPCASHEFANFCRLTVGQLPSH